MPELKPNQTRIQTIELLKFFSAFGVVLFHSQVPGKLIPFAGLICFLIASFYFLPHSMDSPEFLIKRLKSLLFPYFAWSLFYGLINICLKNPFFGNDSDPLLLMLIRGGATHLWYLPFTVFVTLFIYVIMKKKDTVPSFNPTFVLLLTFSLSFTTILLRWYFNERIPIPIAQWVHALPAVSIGLYLSTSTNFSKWAKGISIIAMLILFLISILIGDLGFGVPYFFGTILSVCAIHFKRIRVPFSIWMGSLSFGIYLIHVFIFMVLGKLGLSAVSHPWIFGLTTFFISAFIVAGLKKIKIPLLEKII